MTWAQRNAQTSLKPVPLVTVTEAAHALGVSRRAVLDWCSRDLLPGAFQLPASGTPRSTPHWRIPQATVDDLLADRRQPENGTP